MSLVQLVECSKCGNTQSIPYDSSNPKPKMPWEVWPNGCPKCGHKKADVTLIHDKSGQITDVTIKKLSFTPKPFKCTKCGVCCRDMVKDTKVGTFGMLLLDGEEKLFPWNLIKPYWGIGPPKGLHKNKPSMVAAWQYIGKECPHISKDNTCLIYSRRPRVCSSYPISIFAFGKDQNATVSPDCPVTRKDFPLLGKELYQLNMTAYMGKQSTLRMQSAIRFLEDYVKQSKGWLWFFHFTTGKWQIMSQPKQVNMNVTGLTTDGMAIN